MIRWFGTGLAVAALLFAAAAGKKEPFTITFHVQGEEHEGSFVRPDPSLGEGIFFRTVPSISHLQMTAFYPFPSKDGTGYGAVFTLNNAGRERLATLRAQEPGRLLRALVNGLPVDTLRVDRGGENDVMVIWRGLTEEHFKLFEKKLQRRQMGG